MEEARNATVVPRGAGGMLGHIGRMIAMVCTGGFAFPNAFTEGMDCTALQKESQGTLYDKKIK